MTVGLAAPLAAASPQELTPGGASRVVEVIDGDTVMLEDGREVRMVGIQAPKLPLGRPNYPTWPLAPEAKATLESLALGQTVALYFGGRQMDRHGRWLAHLVTQDGIWLQAAMIERGLARHYSFPDNRALALELRDLERQARTDERGIWALRYYSVREPEELAGDTDSFQLVSGRVQAVAERRERTYVNFGADWKTDFTLVIENDARKLFEAAGLDLKSLEGRIVEARGWIESFNGPMIEITHPEQIELLDEDLSE